MNCKYKVVFVFDVMVGIYSSVVTVIEIENTTVVFRQNQAQLKPWF